MPSLPQDIITILVSFAPLFSRPVWEHAQVLLVGAILCRGPRTVASALRTMGLSDEQRFEKYHRVLNRARWSALQGAKLLLGLLIRLLPAAWPILIVVDETIERRQGAQIKAKGCYLKMAKVERDAPRPGATALARSRTSQGHDLANLLWGDPGRCPGTRHIPQPFF